MGGEAGMGLRVRASSLLLSLVLELAVALVSGNSSRSRRLGRSLLACMLYHCGFSLSLLARALLSAVIALFAANRCRVRLSQ
jgi:hypothetical protein